MTFLQVLSHEQCRGLITSTPHESFRMFSTFNIFRVISSCRISLLRHQTDLIGTFLYFHRQMAYFRVPLLTAILLPLPTR